MAGSGGKGGGAPQQPFNVNQAAAQGLQNAMSATNQAITAPLNSDLYMNPYTQQVVDTTQADIERQRQMAINNMGAQAQAAGAFGGSRHGVAEAQTNAEYGRVAANALAPLRMQGYQNAMTDRSQRLGAASQLGSMANQAFNTGRTINQDLAAQGLMQQGLQQALIDTAKTDFANYANSPTQSLNAPIAAVGAARYPTTTTASRNPGLLGILGAMKYANIF